MAELDGGPLYNEWLAFSEGQPRTKELFTRFVTDNLTRANVDVPGTTATALYSGKIGDQPAFLIARDLVDRSGGTIRIIDDTNIGKLLNFVFFSPEGKLSLDFVPDSDFRDARFFSASEKLALETRGPVITITPNSESARIYAQAEVPNLLNSGATHINGRPIDEIRAAYRSTDAEARKAYFKALFDGEFARIIAQSDGTALLAGTIDGEDRVALRLDRETLDRLGLAAINLDPVDGRLGPPVVDNDALKAEMANGWARALLVDLELTRYIDNPSLALAIIGGDLFDEAVNLRALRIELARMILEFEKSSVPEPREALASLAGFFKSYIEKLPDNISSVTLFLKNYVTEFPDLFDDAVDSIKGRGVSFLAAIRRFIDDETGSLRLPNFKLDAQTAKIGAAVIAEGALGLIEVHVQYKRYGGFTEDFWNWAGEAAKSVAIAVPIGIGAVYAAGLLPYGPAILLGLAAVGTYFAIREVTKGVLEVYANEKDTLIYKSAKFIDDFMKEFEGTIIAFLEPAAELMKAFAIVLKPIAEYFLPSIQYFGGQNLGFIVEEGEWLFGADAAILIGDDAENVLIHTGAGQAHGLDGEDILIGWGADFIPKGEKIGPAPAEGQEDTRPVAETDLRLKLDGGAGDDWVIALGGTGAITIGGKGRDFLFNSSASGQIYGDTIDGVGQSTSGLEDSDVFWYWPGSFIMDAQPNDILQMFGIPLLGGTNAIAGFPAGDGSLAADWINPFVFYGLTQTNQLIVYNALLDALDIGPDIDGILGSAMIVENYDFGGWQNSAWGIPSAGDLGMTFRIYLPRDRASEGVEISLWNAVWGELITRVNVLLDFAKAIRWRPVDDPLVIDLDGDGIETVSERGSRVHFDLDADFFAERTGWVSPDDGFLVIDADGNGRIDDGSEMFGGPGRSAYAELATLDDTGDGVITVADAAFDQLRVWRDLDQDGFTDDGELFTLGEVDIVSLQVGGTELGVETPQGNLLRATATYTRSDLSTGNTFEAIFDTNPTDTIFRGERGVAEWLKDSPLPTAKGFGTMAELSVQASSDFALADTVTAVAASMTTPKLKDLRAQVTPVFGAWAQSLELTRELTPALLHQGPDGTTLIDRAVYEEDAAGGFWRLDGGAAILDTAGLPIDRPTLEDVLAQSVEAGQIWRLEQMFSPSSRAAPLEHRQDAPYLATIVEGRAVIQDYGIENPDGSWRLASGAAVTDSAGGAIAAPTRDDILALAPPAGAEWRVESLGHNPYADLDVTEMGVYLVDGTVVDYTIFVTDEDGGFHVWARNVDRALQLQQKLGRPGDFILRNYEVDFDTLDEVGSTDDSVYRVEILTAGQFHFASSIYGVDFQPQVMVAGTDPDTGLLSYSVGSFGGESAPTTDADGRYVSTIKPAIEFFDVMMQNYITVSRAFAVRLALQGGLSEFARGLAYDAASDRYRATTDLELAPMFEAIFE